MALRDTTVNAELANTAMAEVTCTEKHSSDQRMDCVRSEPVDEEECDQAGQAAIASKPPPVPMPKSMRRMHGFVVLMPLVVLLTITLELG